MVQNLSCFVVSAAKDGSFVLKIAQVYLYVLCQQTSGKLSHTQLYYHQTVADSMLSERSILKNYSHN